MGFVDRQTLKALRAFWSSYGTIHYSEKVCVVNHDHFSIYGFVGMVCHATEGN